ncbi:MerR family transcriptional regulator [Agreia sp. Leaf244]|nr:MerR family transcriptional regulator [Agreia sp. Leaf244]
MRIGELAQSTGVSPRALRYYEEQGLLVADRSTSGQRNYADSAVEKVLFFQDMYAAGLSSRNIATLLPCIESGHTTAEQRDMLEFERNRIRMRVGQLTSALDRLDGVIAATGAHP